MASLITESIELQRDVKLNVVISTPDKSSAPEIHPTIVLLHYWGGSIRTWSAVNALISLDYDTVAIDFRGWGESSGPPDPNKYSITHLADDVEAVVQHLALKQVVLVGLSMGAKVAQLIAGRGGSLAGWLKGIVLVSPAPPTPLVLPPEASEQQIHAYDSWQSAEFVARNVLTSTSTSLGDDVFKMVVEDMLRGNEWARAAWPAYGMGEDIVETAKNINVSALVVAAEKDLVEPLDRVKKEVCGNVRGAELVVVPDSGHLSPLQAPEEVARRIKGFISAISV